MKFSHFQDFVHSIKFFVSRKQEFSHEQIIIGILKKKKQYKL